MEEDIKILEEYIENLFKYGDRELLEKENIVKCIEFKEIQAIENLLKRYKELEEENYLQRSQLNSAFDRGFIHKSKIKDKIEELYNRDEYNYIISKTKRIIYKEDIKNILQELIEEE